jgi:glycosyltransferase involved in cell wall biosynthesis
MSLLAAAETWARRILTDRIVAVGWETAKTHAERLGSRHIDVIPNAVGPPQVLSDAEREAVRKELGLQPESLLVLAVGRLHPQKAFPDLLRSFALLKNQFPHAQLRIAGPGRLRGELEALLHELDLDDRVEFLGRRRDVETLLAASDVYVSSALWEGLPLATLEAMAAGLPLVVTDVGDVPRIVTADTGTLVEPGDVSQMTHALVRVLSDQELRRSQGEAARRHAIEEYGSELWADRLLALYEDLQPPTDGSRGLKREGPACVS